MEAESEKSPNLRDFQGLRLNENIRAGELDGVMGGEEHLRGKNLARLADRLLS